MRGPRGADSDAAILAWDALLRREDADAQRQRAERLAAAVRCAREMRDDSITFNSATYWYEQETVLLAALQPGDLGDGQEDAG